MEAGWAGFDQAYPVVSPECYDWINDYQHPALPTPPPSNESTPCEFSFSSSFHPASSVGAHSDLVFASLDCILFYVNSGTFTRISRNAFEDHIAQCSGPVSISGYIQNVVHIPESSTMLDIMMHILYDLPFSHTPSFPAISEALIAMTKYEIYPSFHLVPSHPCSKVLLSYAPLYPLELYTVSAQLDIYHLAASASSHLLSYPPWTITDDIAKKIGAVYVKKLLALYAYRTDTLKKIVLAPPEPHSLSEHCHFALQKKLERAWAQAAARLVWDIKPDISPVAIRMAFKGAGDQITCQECLDALDARIKDVVNRWVCVKRSI